MSGTSADGVDGALVEIEHGKVKCCAATTTAYDQSLRKRLLTINDTRSVSLDELLRLDYEIAIAFAATAEVLIQGAGGADALIAIGSHGQTIFHQPNGSFPGTLQVGNASVIANRTGVDTVADFRSADMACGGQGAPLTPAFNNAVFNASHSRVILNLGGIANLTFLDEKTLGFDTGPANTLLDGWSSKHLQQPYDEDGQWARTGSCNDALLTSMLSDTYFAKEPPKSTGPDHFNQSWLQLHIDAAGTCPPEDVQATLVELTARSVANSILRNYPDGVEVLLCGGGSHNAFLVERLADTCRQCTIRTTEQACGLNVDHCESVAFAWFAYRYIAGLPGNVPAVTGASREVVLGALHKAS